MNNTDQLKLWDTFKHKFFDNKGYSTRRKIYNTLWAVLFGFIISGFVITLTGNNPFLVFASIIEQGVTSFSNKLISIFVAYLFASLAVAICFKGGLFNIGISGQMMGAGFTTLLIFRSEILNSQMISGGSVVLALFVAIAVGALISIIAGALKAFFGINEVVLTIMLNWVIFFLIKFFVFEYAKVDGLDFLASDDTLASNLSIGYGGNLPSIFYPQDINFSWYTNTWNWIIILIGIVAVGVIWFIFSKTTFGYQIKMVGLNKDASEYSGTNQKTLTILIMAISGGMAGLAGFIWYIGQGGQIDIAEQPLLAGFDAIAISLLVFNNPISIWFSSLMYGILSIGSNGLASQFVGMNTEINQIIIGLFVYCAAITVIFSKLNVFTWMKNFFILCRHKEHQDSAVRYWGAKWEYFISWFKVKRQIYQLKNENKPTIAATKKMNEKFKKLDLYFMEKYNMKKFDKKLLSNEDIKMYEQKAIIFGEEFEKDLKEAENLWWKKINWNYWEKITNLENDIKQKNNLDKFDIKKLETNEQLFYFDKLSIFKKEKDTLLAQAKFFDQYTIKARRDIKFKEEQKRYHNLKEEMLKEYYKMKEEIQLSKKQGRGN